MTKLALSHRVPRDYDAASMQEIVRQFEAQANQFAEGRLRARHAAMTAAPTAGNYEKGDIVWNSAPALVADAISDYVLLGWICTTSGTPGTFQEIRVLAEAITTTLHDPVLGTEVASTSGTSIDFTGIPAWVTEIVINGVGVSTNGTSNLIFQLGDAGGIEATGYSGCVGTADGIGVAAANFSTSFVGITGGLAAAGNYSFQVRLVLENSTAFTWSYLAIVSRNDVAVVEFGAGTKATSAVLDRVRITTAGGVDTFDAGVINIQMS